MHLCRSLGAVLYEVCTLQRAFPGSNLMAVMYRIVEGERPDLPSAFNPELRQLFTRYCKREVGGGGGGGGGWEVGREGERKREEGV